MKSDKIYKLYIKLKKGMCLLSLIKVLYYIWVENKGINCEVSNSTKYTRYVVNFTKTVYI